MMGIYIKNVEMPECCEKCDFCRWSNLHQTAACFMHNYNACFEDYSEDYCKKRSEFCPLTEVKETHGRLIDADAFDERVRVAGGMSEEELTEDFKDGVQTVLYMLSKQPTIIEAEGSEE